MVGPKKINFSLLPLMPILALLLISFGLTVPMAVQAKQSPAKATESDRSGDDKAATMAAEMRFASDVTTHVVLHELAHALVREFDLPVLGNEETLADTFATYYLTTHMPERSLEVITARVRSLMIEAREVPRREWNVNGEHNSDARRAYQITAVAIAADPEKFTELAKAIGMTERDIRSAADYGTEIHRSWRRTLRKLMMPEGVESREVRFNYDNAQNKVIQKLRASGITKEIEAAVKRFDWHSQVVVSFIEGDGGAGWNRGRRTITVYTEYVERFIKQGQTAEARPQNK